ncbi:SEC-C domain-containing protein [Rossellomorea vietnamensis]|uniref:SEC-C domain-containing protein n=1 Tax=Rossellomorea vietnamensis TaxID=218284 RepID=A0A5D4NYC9_9BACI|nr:SEC-C domain-containing protein [Rossellomorea vietnamensis]TYS17722.1 SEC-C domain-containing protein [Rossellomorea vietnamensis]
MNDSDSKTFTISTKVKKTDYSHSSFMSLYLASASSGQAFRVYKDIDIKDLNIEGYESKEGRMVMMEFRPNHSELPFLETEFWADLVEDPLNRTLSIQLSNDRNADNAPYMVKLKFRSKGNVNFNIEPSPFASAKEWNKWYSILSKIRGLDYRRTYILGKDKSRLVTSACPNLDNTLSTFEGEFLKKLSILEDKIGNPIIPPTEISQELLDSVIEINEKWEHIDDAEREKEIQQLEKDLNIPMTTLISVQLKNQETDLNRMMIIQHLGWIKYSSFGLKFDDFEKRKEWDKIIKNQSAISYVVNARTFTPEDFFNQLSSLRQEGEYNILSMVNKLLKINSEELPPIKTNIEVKLQEPIGSVQEIQVTIQQADDDYNKMEKLLFEEKYVQAIPFLEKIGANKETLAYAYAINHQYDEAIELADKIIAQDVSTVAHMTKGLAYVGKGEYHSAFDAYQLGIHICRYKWYPIAKENLESFVLSNNTQMTKELQNIIELLDKEREPMNPKEKCYCGSKRRFKKCHGKVR